jgi:hypothetical protein
VTGGTLGGDLPTLVIKGGPADGHSHELQNGQSVLVGSGRLAHFRVGNEDQGIGLAHIKVTWDETGISVTDNGSSSGTFVNGEPVETAVLLDGDVISFQPPDSKLKPPSVLIKIPPGSVIIAPPPPKEESALTGAKVATPTPAAARGGPKAAPAGGLRIPGIGTFSIPKFDFSSLRDIKLPAPSRQPPPGPARGAAPARGAPPARGAVPSRGAAPARAAAAAPGRRPAPRRRGPSVNPVLVGTVVGGLAVLAGAYLAAQRFFFSAPVLSAVSPVDADTGATVTLSGKRFDVESTLNKVWFGETSVPVVTGTEESLTVRVPEAPPAGGQVELAVETSSGRSKTLPFTIHTTLGAGGLDPEAALPGDVVMIKGQGFLEGQPSVSVAGRTAQVVGAERTGLRFKMPSVGQEPGTWVPVLVRVGPQTAKPIELLVGRLPVILQANPPRAAAGERIGITGRGFAAEVNGNAVTIGGAPALVLQASPRELQVVVPPPRGDSGQEETPVVVRAGGRESTNKLRFILARPQGGTYLLRFFPSAATDTGSRMVLVTSEAGPTLLLSSPEGAPSATSRAVKVAAALNGALDQARNGSAVVFEARQSPSPGVALAGGTELLVQATPDDSAAYAAPPGTNVHTAVPSLEALADHWAALLNDCLAVFVQNEKPMRLMALSSRGRTLLELRSALGWRAGSGIPSEKVGSMPADLLQRIRDASLIVGGAGQGSAAAAVEGTWEGQMEDNAGSRAIVVRLRAEGAVLSGRLTSQTSALSAEVALRDISFKGNVLRFTLPAGAGTRIFVGNVAGSTVAGTLHASANGPSVGTFSLRNVP